MDNLASPEEGQYGLTLPRTIRLVSSLNDVADMQRMAGWATHIARIARRRHLMSPFLMMS
jgi:hypothetical protein